MTDTQTTSSPAASLNRALPDLPLVIWMVLLTIAVGLGTGLGAERIITEFNLGFGRALGEFALILLPSFTLAAALARQHVISETAGRTAMFLSPVAGAGMVCPDTAYAALSPAAGRYKLAVAYGAYAGFKLLYPAGPLIVAAGLGVLGHDGTTPGRLLLCGLLLMVPILATGIFWGRLKKPLVQKTAHMRTASGDSRRLLVSFIPFIIMTGLLILGSIIGPTEIGPVDFLLMPKGALLAAAAVAMAQTPADERRACLDSAVRRTGALLLVIGVASAFGVVLTGQISPDRFLLSGGGISALLLLFGLTALFKLAQGSSMATFAAVTPVAAPVVMTNDVNATMAVFAVCLGSFIAILPNDSYYWLLRDDTFAEEKSDRHVIRILATGVSLQAIVGMGILLGVAAIWP
ncbi:hypothetical protein [Aestuariispira insulae]|uniref:GntP family gluconate:H+ symporter n=1 Tax=Aestuariispira insulae TaxID=1461337 RepID=A0A3D9HI24_9PROT|nr:hypothetical protein [Aestuariispira insulae]RED49192.1 GntP family gluconate:H+ symporter [Aestuariispira insulae]